MANRPKVLVADAIAAAGVETLRQVAEVTVEPAISAEEVLTEVANYAALVVRSRTKAPAAVVAAATKLEVIGRAGVGVDNIDLEACKRHGITVVNSPLAASAAVAELTLALMLALARQVPFADQAIKSGDWPKKQLKGIELDGKTLGLVAIGRIGAATAARAAAFGMKVLAYDPLLSETDIRERGAEPATLETVLANSDFISIHTPLTAETRHMIGEDAIAAMKPGVRLISVARGGVIDEAALLAALGSGQVAGAALDVFETEPPGATALVRHPNLLATPHIGAQTAEAQIRAGVDIGEEVSAALTGGTLRWRVV